MATRNQAIWAKPKRATCVGRWASYAYPVASPRPRAEYSPWCAVQSTLAWRPEAWYMARRVIKAGAPGCMGHTSKETRMNMAGGTRAVQVIHERETQCSVPMNSCIFTWEKDELDRVRGKRQCMPRTIMLIISQHWAKPIKVRLVLPARIPGFVLFELQWKKSSTKASFGYVCMYLHKYAVVSQVPAKDAGTRP